MRGKDPTNRKVHKIKKNRKIPRENCTRVKSSKSKAMEVGSKRKKMANRLRRWVSKRKPI